MKRTNIVLNETLLKQAQLALDTSTMSETVNAALNEVVRSSKVKKMLELAGSGAWQGDLAEMRDELPRQAPKRRRNR